MTKDPGMTKYLGYDEGSGMSKEKEYDDYWSISGLLLVLVRLSVPEASQANLRHCCRVGPF